jgi:hypothetical protein
MSMIGNTCPKCWDNPCTCGFHFNYVAKSVGEHIDSKIKHLQKTIFDLQNEVTLLRINHECKLPENFSRTGSY